MTSTLSIGRALRIWPPAQQAAYYVILSFADAPFELAASTERDRLTVDGISALFVGPTSLDSLLGELPPATAPLLIEIPASLSNSWDLPATDLSFLRTGPIRRAVVMSAGSLLLARRLRQRAITEQTSRDGTSFLEFWAPETAAVLLDELVTDLIEAPPPDKPRQNAVRRRALVDRARRRLAQSPEAPHPLPTLADTLGASSFHFARLFRSETGLSVHQYLLRLRMARALRYLTRRDTDLSRLALELGFSSHSHFTSTFHREFGVNPAGVRSMLDRERRCANTRYLAWPTVHRTDADNRARADANQHHSA